MISILVFYSLAFTLGASVIYLVVQEVLPASLALTSVFSVSVAGFVMTAIENGRSGLGLMFKRLLIWRVGIGYWLFALIFLVPAFLLGSLFNPIFNGDPISVSNLRPSFDLLPLFIGFIIIAGLGQEMGWTGFLLPRLQARFGALTSCVIRAILVGIWHLPLFIYSRLQLPQLADFPYAGWITQKGFLVAFGVSILMFALPWSVLFGWIFNNTNGSLLLVAILHGSEFWVAYWMVRTEINPNNLDNYWGYGAVLVLTAIVIILKTGSEDLARKQKRIMHQPMMILETS